MYYGTGPYASALSVAGERARIAARRICARAGPPCPNEEDELLARAVDASEALDEAVRGVAEAEHELDLFITDPSS